MTTSRMYPDQKCPGCEGRGWYAESRGGVYSETLPCDCLCPVPRAWYVPPEADRSRLPIVRIVDDWQCLAPDPTSGDDCERAAGHTGRHFAVEPWDEWIPGETTARVIAVWGDD